MPSLRQLLKPAACLILCLTAATASGNPARAEATWKLHSGPWQLTFHAADQLLVVSHPDSGVELAGPLQFEGSNSDGAAAAWRVTLPHDSVTSRLALLDPDGNIQGYITFPANGDSLQFSLLHRTAQNFHGRLTFTPSFSLGPRAFACRLNAPVSGRVVQMAAGHADSALNHAVFDIESDTALSFDALQCTIQTDLTSADHPEFQAHLTAQIDDPAHAAIELTLTRHYYQARFAPYYHPINKERCPVAPTGWMSWNVYFDKAGEEENLAEARVAAEYLKPYGMEFFSIESWQDNSPTLPVSQFHNLTLRPDPNKFPSGMKWLADEIRKLGFRPGIWTVPFGTGDPDFYAEHKDWFLHHPDGTPMSNWCGRYLLDPSQDAVRQHMEETHRIMAQEWDYEYFKIDGMSGRNSGYSAHFYERPEVRAAFKEEVDDPFLLCTEALRSGIGPDRVWLACQGHFTGADSRYADAGRIGADIVHPNRPPDWNNYRNQARTTLNQLFVNNIIWYGDPDTLLVGTENPLETARLAASVVALTGQAMFAGDRLGELPRERMRLLQQCLPVCDIRPLDLYPIYEMLPVWDLKVRSGSRAWDVVSLFNWADSESKTEVSFSELGLASAGPYLVYDCWNRTLQRNVQGELAAIVPAHANALLAVYPQADQPQVVFSDRHIAQGAIGLDQVEWSSQTLSGTIELVGSDPTELVIAVPDGLRLTSATTDANVTIATAEGANNTVIVRLQTDRSRESKWSLSFE